MEEIATAALIGTARLGQKPVMTTPAIDELMAQSGENDREHALLLQAGAYAVYKEAGQLPEQMAEPVPMPALPETLPTCSPQAAALLELLIKQHTDLMPEALDRMSAKGLCVPPELLPTIFQARLENELRPALRQVIGERGRWLAQFNKAWAWATEAPLAGDALPPDAETIWQEGGPAQRIEVLQRMRAVDAAKAREWIAQVWKQEKADFRAEMLGTCMVGLAAEDEPLLERALDDRVDKVRNLAAIQLRHLPTSALSQRMITRAESMVQWEHGTLTVKLKRDIEQDPGWVRDGLDKDVPRKTSKTDWALGTVLRCIPLRHWTERYGVGPEKIIEAAQKTDHAGSFLLSWTHAAQMGHCAEWITPLWDWWLAPSELRESHEAWALYQLLAYMTPMEAEQRARQVMPAPGENSNKVWEALVRNLPGPWSESFGNDFLMRIFAYLARLLVTLELDLELDWTQDLDDAALCLPPACFVVALAPVEIPERNTWHSRQWRNLWESFTESITLRQRILEEII